MTEHEKRMASLHATLNAGVPPAEAAMAYAHELASERDALAGKLAEKDARVAELEREVATWRDSARVCCLQFGGSRDECPVHKDRT